MRIRVASLVVGALLTTTIVGCAPAADSATAAGDPELVAMLLNGSDAGGWLVSPDEGEVGGVSGDCTGAPFAWVDLRVEAVAAEFLDRPDESISLTLKRMDADASIVIDQVREALDPCTPEGTAREHGAMIDPVASDSFAYQTRGDGADGEFGFSNILIACGPLLLEGQSMSFSDELDQAELEALVAPVVERMIAAEACTA